MNVFSLYLVPGVIYDGGKLCLYIYVISRKFSVELHGIKVTKQKKRVDK